MDEVLRRGCRLTSFESMPLIAQPQRRRHLRRFRLPRAGVTTLRRS